MQVGAHYPPSGFMDVIRYSIGHEFFHVIGGAPNLVSTSPRWVTFAAVTNAVTNSAVLSMTQEHAEGFKVWELDFGGATTNGTFAWQWQGASNDFLRAEIPTNAAGATMPLALAYIDAGFDGQTNEAQEAYSLYRHDDTNGFWGSTYSITGPREETGMPAFSAHNAFIVRVPPEAAFADGTELVCRLLPEGEEDDAIETEMERQADGSYVTGLIVPMLEIDGNTGLESVTNAVKLKFKGNPDNPFWNGWQYTRIIISKKLDVSMREVAATDFPVRRAALFSALVTNEENGEARANYGVKQAGEYARSHLGYGVTPLFSPDAAMLDNQLPRHRVWVHSGHGHNVGGVVIVQKQGNKYKAATLRAGDITSSDLEYDLVFMNTCLSTDVEFTPNINSETGWDEVPIALSRHDVLDIGFKLNAKNHVGWTCSVEREVSIHVPTMLMTALNTYLENGTLKQRNCMEATAWVRREMVKKRGAHEIFAPRLVCTMPAGNELDETRFDLDGKPY